MSDHGGQRLATARRYGRAETDWLDLSTGISPWCRVPSQVPTDVWQRLPEADDRLAATAADYYRTTELAAVPGSQAALQLLPRLRQKSHVAVTRGSYAEHHACWGAAGHAVIEVEDHDLPRAGEHADVVIVVNPDNPTGRRIDPAVMLGLHADLARHGGWLIVDEAFADAESGVSILPLSGRSGLIVLRSLGKFFGLAGVRLGFVGAPPSVRAALTERLGPWAVSHPARHAGGEALADRRWQHDQRRRLDSAAARLDEVLRRVGLEPSGGTALFRYCPHPDAALVAEQLAARGVLVRHFESPPALRVGLPGTESGWRRLTHALFDNIAGGGRT